MKLGLRETIKQANEGYKTVGGPGGRERGGVKVKNK